MPGKPKGLPKTGGRKPGSQNRVTKETKEQISEVINLTASIYSEKLIAKANSKDPDEVADFMDRFEKLLEYGIPKLQRSESSTELSFKDGLKIGYGDRGVETGN